MLGQRAPQSGCMSASSMTKFLCPAKPEQAVLVSRAGGVGFCPPSGGGQDGCLVRPSQRLGRLTVLWIPLTVWLTPVDRPPILKIQWLLRSFRAEWNDGRVGGVFLLALQERLSGIIATIR